MMTEIRSVNTRMEEERFTTKEQGDIFWSNGNV